MRKIVFDAATFMSTHSVSIRKQSTRGSERERERERELREREREREREAFSTRI